MEDPFHEPFRSSTSQAPRELQARSGSGARPASVLAFQAGVDGVAGDRVRLDQTRAGALRGPAGNLRDDSNRMTKSGRKK
jgi:hypothetical protein